MKKIIMLSLLLGTLAGGTLQAQTVLEKAQKAGKALDILPIGDIGQTANSILGVLKPKLSLTETQSPKVLGLVTDFLQSKSAIIPEAKSDPAGYTSKFGGLKEKLLSGLKTAVTASQFKSLLGLKPKTSSAGNVLSHLFF